MTDTVQVPCEATDEIRKEFSAQANWNGYHTRTEFQMCWARALAAAPQATDPRDGDFTPEEERAWAAILQGRDAEIERLKARRECHLSTMGALAIERDAAQAENERLRAALDKRISELSDQPFDIFCTSITRCDVSRMIAKELRAIRALLPALSPPPLSPEKE